MIDFSWLQNVKFSYFVTYHELGEALYYFARKPEKVGRCHKTEVVKTLVTGTVAFLSVGGRLHLSKTALLDISIWRINI